VDENKRQFYLCTQLALLFQGDLYMRFDYLML
jgi:hypothetical protein